MLRATQSFRVEGGGSEITTKGGAAQGVNVPPHEGLAPTRHGVRNHEKYVTGAPSLVVWLKQHIVELHTTLLYAPAPSVSQQQTTMS